MEELLNKAKQRLSNAESQRRVTTAPGTKGLPLKTQMKAMSTIKNHVPQFQQIMKIFKI